MHSGFFCCASSQPSPQSTPAAAAEPALKSRRRVKPRSGLLDPSVSETFGWNFRIILARRRLAFRREARGSPGCAASLTGLFLLFVHFEGDGDVLTAVEAR